MAVYNGPHHGTLMFKSFTKIWHTQPYPEISPLRPELSAKGKVIFITGGGTGIGKATAISFAQTGAKIIAIFGRRLANLQAAADEIRKANSNGTTAVIYESVDITQRSAVNAAFANAIKQAGEHKIDIFVNNAGMLKPPSTVTSQSETHLREMIEGNLIGSFNAVQAIIPFLAPKSKILNISSGVAHIDPLPGFWVYGALKLAIVKMFDFLQVENPDIGVFNIQPGVVTTEINQISGSPGQDDGKPRARTLLIDDICHAHFS